MPPRSCAPLVLGFVVLSLLAAVATAQMVDISTDSARVFAAPPGQSLAGGGAGDPRSAVAAFLSSRQVPGRALDSLVVTSRNDTTDGRSHVQLAQEVDGLRVYGTYVRASFDASGNLVHVIENLITPPARGLGRANVDPLVAVRTAVSLHHPDFRGALSEGASTGLVTKIDGGSYFHGNPTATRIAVALSNGRLDEGYLVQTWSEADNLLYHTVVGRNGQVLYSELRTAADSYNVFPDNPAVTPQIVVNGPGAGNSESPAGWLFSGTQRSQGSQDIAGNNVNAYIDADANNASDGIGAPVTDGNFLTVADLAQDPATTTNKDVAVQNLFYLNNVIHDKLYRHGFTEAAGNFQENNFGFLGAGGDSVNAEAQDGSGTNNANFSTPSDGSNPRMQMYLWTQTTPRRDGDVDSDIVYHEYGHGLTWRMIGNMSGSMSGAIGEGMSDVVSILMNNDDTVGEYSTNDPFGVRSAPYTSYPRTYGDFTGQSVHFDGEIYAGTLWRVWENFQGASVPQDTLWDYVVDGMNFTPAGPAMEDMRDGILASAAGSGNECLIWDGFAAFGIGVGATGQVKGGGPLGGGRVTITESFAVPAECTGGGGGGGGGTCELGQPGDPCTSNADCCSNSCKGRPGRQTCK